MVGGDGFHMVNSGLMVLTMLGEYLEVTRRLPLLSTEVVHRVAELLKLFNSRTCQVRDRAREREGVRVCVTLLVHAALFVGAEARRGKVVC
jgi:hypothetical protein